jgi:hypothetical protein
MRPALRIRELTAPRRSAARARREPRHPLRGQRRRGPAAANRVLPHERRGRTSPEPGSSRGLLCAETRTDADGPLAPGRPLPVARSVPTLRPQKRERFGPISPCPPSLRHLPALGGGCGGDAPQDCGREWVSPHPWSVSVRAWPG